jgi:hypothetical protein
MRGRNISMIAVAKHLGVASSIVLGLMSMGAQATTYNLTFNNSSIIDSTGREIISDASFNPITLFNGDTLSVVFNNVPPPTSFPQFIPGTALSSILYGLGGVGAINETVSIGGGSGGTFGPLLMKEYGSNFYTNAFASGPLYYGSPWTITLQLLSGDPPDSSGLAIDKILVNVTLVPEPSTWAMLADRVRCDRVCGISETVTARRCSRWFRAATNKRLRILRSIAHHLAAR